jgi:hypothetical protein
MDESNNFSFWRCCMFLFASKARTLWFPDSRLYYFSLRWKQTIVSFYHNYSIIQCNRTAVLQVIKHKHYLNFPSKYWKTHKEPTTEGKLRNYTCISWPLELFAHSLRDILAMLVQFVEDNCNAGTIKKLHSYRLPYLHYVSLLPLNQDGLFCSQITTAWILIKGGFFNIFICESHLSKISWQLDKYNNGCEFTRHAPWRTQCWCQRIDNETGSKAAHWEVELWSLIQTLNAAQKTEKKNWIKGTWIKSMNPISSLMV